MGIENTIPIPQRCEEHGAGYWRRPWDEEGQADYLEAVYRLLFGLEPVAAITWWNAVDELAFIGGGGLFRSDRSAKPALERLESLIAGWTSAGETSTGHLGQATVTGYAGDYQITVQSGEASVTFGAHISERSERIHQLCLPASPPRQPDGRRAR